jgi:hypothetical protein
MILISILKIMLTPKERELFYELLSKIEISEFFVFDVSELSQASYLAWLHWFSMKIYKAIIELYIIDITGCIDSEL